MRVNPLRLKMAYLQIPRFLPHILFYFLDSNKSKIRSDVNSFKDFVYRLCWDVTYRNIFYYRVGRKQILFSWLAPRCPYTKISQDMIVGKTFRMEHAFLTFVNAKRVGDNFFCFHNVTIGANGREGGVPTIGDKVTFCCGSSALGNITIGNNVTIGVSTLILNDVPDNCTVVGNPAVIVKLKGEKMRILLKDYKAQ